MCYNYHRISFQAVTKGDNPSFRIAQPKVTF